MKKLLTLILLLSVAFGSCDASRRKAKHVVFIGIDGWAAYSLRDTPAEELPNIHYLMENGAWSTHKRSVMPSASAINWCTLFTGVPTEMHGYDKWNSKAPSITPAQIGPNGMPSTIFTILREQRPSAETGAIYNWDGIGYVIDTAAVDYHFYDESRAKKVPGYNPMGYVQTYMVPYIIEKTPELVLCYFGDLDAAGHGYGWDSPQYAEMLRKCDECIGVLILALKDADIWDDTIIVLTTDHGGSGRGHGKFTIKELEGPVIICGRKVRSNYEIPIPVMQYDITAIAAYALGLDIPDWWVGRPFKSIFK